MKKNTFWFSLIEVIVGVLLLSIAVLSVVSSLGFLNQRDEILDVWVKNMYFNDYVFQISTHLEIPEWNIWQKYYLSQDMSNSFVIDENPNNSTNDMWFFVESDPWIHSHEIEKISENIVEFQTFSLYKITSRINENVKISFLTK